MNSVKMKQFRCTIEVTSRYEIIVEAESEDELNLDYWPDVLSFHSPNNVEIDVYTVEEIEAGEATS